MPEIEVNLAALESGQAGVQQSFTRLQGTLDQLEADLAPMIASWSGAAQESYLGCKNSGTTRPRPWPRC